MAGLSAADEVFSLTIPAALRRLGRGSSLQSARELTRPFTSAELRDIVRSRNLRELLKGSNLSPRELPLVSSEELSPEALAAVQRILRGGSEITTPDSIKDIVNLSALSPMQRARIMRGDSMLSDSFNESVRGLQNVTPTESGFVLRGEEDLVPLLPTDIDTVQRALREISLRRNLENGAELTDVTTAYRSPTFITQDEELLRRQGPLSYSRGTQMYPEVNDIYEADVPTYAILGDASIGQNYNPIEDEIIVAGGRERAVRGPYTAQDYGLPKSNIVELVRKMGFGNAV